MNTTPRRIAILVVSLFLAAAGQAAADTTYRITELGQANSPTKAYGINNLGQVVGQSMMDAGEDEQHYRQYEHATLWDKTRVVDLDRGNYQGGSYATGINDAGQVVGHVRNRGGSFGALWNGGNYTYFDYASASGINNAGTVAGTYYSSSRAQATVWRNGRESDATRLDAVTEYGYTGANDINDADQVVGYADTASGYSHATRWDGGAATDLGTLGGNESYAFNINNAGQVVGHAQAADNVFHAAIWNGTTIRDLGTLGRGDYRAVAINESGLVVGRFNTGVAGPADSYHAILWNGSAMVDLNSLLDPSLTQAGWVMNEATGINDRGDIVGNMRNRYTQMEHGVVLSAVPEADTYAMLLAGLGMLGFMAHRRRNAA